MIVATKRCRKCQEEKPATPEFFSPAKRYAGGLNSWCRDCRREYKNNWRAGRRETERAVERARYARDVERQRERLKLKRLRKLERVPDWDKRRYQARREQAIANTRRYYWSNRDRVLAAASEWKRQNRVQATANENKRRARKRDAGGSFNAADVARRYAQQEGRCWWCSEPVGTKYQIDHLVPLARGGSNDASNIVIACPKCNARKHDKLPHEFTGRLL